ncbi:MAG: hypothetical protein K2W96_01055 [Gemmataceae bacterium]|nr:hypothetical protein [Gemmataceae bacterium]
MGWKMHEDGLALEDGIHYDAKKVKALVAELRTAPNYPGEICDRITEIVDTGIVRSEWIFRLSKWCHWNNWSQYTARKIAAELFHGHIPRRLLDKENSPMPSWEEAVKDYNEWRNAVVNKLPVTTHYPLEPQGGKSTSSSKWSSIRRIVSGLTDQ